MTRQIIDLHFAIFFQLHVYAKLSNCPFLSSIELSIGKMSTMVNTAFETSKIIFAPKNVENRAKRVHAKNGRLVQIFIFFVARPLNFIPAL